MVALDTTVNTGDGVTPITNTDQETYGVVYDGILDTLLADVPLAQAWITVNNIYSWAYQLGNDITTTTIQLRDDTGNTDHMTMNAVTVATDRNDLTVGTTFAHTILNNTRVLLEYGQNDYFKLLIKGPTAYLHVDGTTDIAIADHITNFSAAGVGYKGWDNFKAIAFEAYIANNSNGLIRAMVIDLKFAIVVNGSFVTAGGTPTAETVEGWEIDVAGESVFGWVDLPNGVATVLGLRITAYSNAIVAQQMQAEIVVEGGKPGEASNIHNQTYANHQTEENNFIVGDLVEWLVNTGIVTVDLTGNDRVKVQVNHEVAGGGDASTDASFRSFEFICV